MRQAVEQIINSKSKTFLAFCFCFLVGVAGAFLLPQLPGSVYWYGLLFVLVAVLIFFWREQKARFWVACLFCLVFGIFRVSIAEFDCGMQNKICFYNGRTVTIAGHVAKYPQETVVNTVYVIGVDSVHDSNKNISANGMVLVKTAHFPHFNFGNAVTLSCRVTRPEPKAGDTFRYDRYLASQGIEALCEFPKGMFAAEGQQHFSLGTFLMQKIFGIKTAFYNKAAELWGEPEGSFLIGLLFGGSSSLPASLQQDFSRTGLSHVLAVSGFNVTIIAVALMGMLIFVGLRRTQAYWVVLGALVVFVFMTGASASVIRAALMGALVLTARQIGRLSQIGVALVAVAALMVLWQPYALLYDAGFQLSFLATIGLVYVPEHLPRFFKEKFGETFVATISAIIMTLPLMLFQFGLFSLVAPIVNVLVLWSVPYLMLGGFSALLAGFIILPLGQVVALVTGLSARVFIFIVHWFSALPFAALNVSLPWWGMVALYIVLLWVLFGKRYTMKIIKSN